MSRSRFEGQIAGVGSASGVRVVIGAWSSSPLGSFADAMVELPSGHRLLLAPRVEVADFIASTYTFDEIRIEPVDVTVGEDWKLLSPSLTLGLTLGRRTPLGRVLRCVPDRVATSPAWCTVTDPFARLALRGVRTRGTAREGRREYYGATDTREIVSLSGRLESRELGALAPVDPPCRFGFSSTPRRPSVTTVVTTVVAA
ncbi:hypothetical protein [Nocardioides sp.]|uniref:hypothetical protein n=1 Tax=Nocardioides sp. TaxID=35761 RepID=UPI002735395F|nr:hypothetical protein [Nocardioides sp.]MDP3893612.1 hypothetical protein [Nocardioides sp.]